MSSTSSTSLSVDANGQLQLPHSDHPEEGHTDEVFGVHLQDDYLVSVSADRTVRTWNLTTRRALRAPLVGHLASVIAVHSNAAPHDDVIITGDAEGNVMIWRFSTGDTIKTLSEAHGDAVISLHFDHRYLVTGGRDNKIKLWNRRLLDAKDNDVPDFAVIPAQGNQYQKYELLATLDGHAAVNALKLKDNVLVSGIGDSTICIWSLNTGQVLQAINVHQSGIACLQFNGRFIVSGSTDNSARIFDVNQNLEVACLQGHTNLIRSIQALFNERGETQKIVSGDYSGIIRIWEQLPGSGEWRTKQEIHVNGFQAQEDVDKDHKASSLSSRIFSVDLDAKRLICSGQGPVIRLWNLVQPGE